MVTINDVAKYAGVSRGTVSNVINNVKVRENSRIKVEQAIKELGYVPNEFARGLKSQRNSTVVLILPTIWNPFFSELTHYIQLELKQHDLKLLLCNSQDDYRVELEYLSMAKQNKVEGIISISYSDIDPYLESNIPMVSIERFYSDSIPRISSDNFHGGYLAAKELVSRGCQSLLLVGKSSKKNISVDKRQRGFVAYCEEHGIQYELFYRREQIEDFETVVHEFFADKGSKPPQFDGIFAVTDRYAQYCIDGLAKQNIACPDDIQIIGFDGAKSYRNETLRISTIRQPVDRLAKAAVSSLLGLINDETIDMEQVFPVEFTPALTTR
ncbi:LacI family DNA-binding transcriptional regulator [Photobacterium rosenbergii]|uniref:LacI family DNA-binding transcriptional regulator n=1 Tax=Photobacterium rosenbergii TaxID=294936 RepID=UPI001C99AD9A|nr:LacI family DNA-binding transcriptional regulator [Photobacterium rosenbergii]MBY5946594.1 LacI family DNA-binding transcriptional regulator [Photobacterium rosenbergii]